MKKIGLISIFINEYDYFFEGWYKSFMEKFFSNEQLYFFVITNSENIVKKENMSIYHIPEKNIKWPIPTLYRFKYFQMIDTHILNSMDYIFFTNSNAICNEKISFNIDYDYTFTRHIYYMNRDYKGKKLLMKDHLFDIPNIEELVNYDSVIDKKYVYIGGRFFGAKPTQFLYLTKTIFNTIGNNLTENLIRKWHDETELNLFFFKNIKTIKYNILNYRYHIDEPMLELSLCKPPHKVYIYYLTKNKYLTKSFRDRDPCLVGLEKHTDNGQIENPRDLYDDYMNIEN